MSAKGGPIRTVAIGGREFRCPGDATPSIHLGGFTAEYEANGDGKTARKLMTADTWALIGVVLEADIDNGDWEYLEEVKRSQDDADIVATLGSGDDYSGTGGIVGELSYDSSKATVSCDLRGPGELKKQ